MIFFSIWFLSQSWADFLFEHKGLSENYLVGGILFGLLMGNSFADKLIEATNRLFK